MQWRYGDKKLVFPSTLSVETHYICIHRSAIHKRDTYSTYTSRAAGPLRGDFNAGITWNPIRFQSKVRCIQTLQTGMDIDVTWVQKVTD